MFLYPGFMSSQELSEVFTDRLLHIFLDMLVRLMKQL